MPCFTTSRATKRQKYAPERSTFDGSLPLNAPPPWRPIPPYESTMILRPVTPQSALGPPYTNEPVGFTRTSMFLLCHLPSTSGQSVFATKLLISLCETLGAWQVDTSTVRTATG